MLTRLQIATAVESISLVQNQRALVNTFINVALNRVYQYYDWPYYLTDEGSIETVATYSTGTATVVNGSTTATLIAPAVVSTDFLYRKVRFQDDQPWYRITAVNTVGNTLTLDAPYQGTSATGISYTIFQDEYRLASDCDKYKTMRQFQNSIPMMDMTPYRFDSMYPTPQSYADPIYNILEGSILEEYTTGTISASGTTITGVGTSWLTAPLLQGLGNMSVIKINAGAGGTTSGVYTIKSVNSDTSITTYESVGTVAALTGYTIILNNLITQLYQIPSSQRVLRYRYFRIPEPMYNDYDVPDMPHEFHHLLIWGCLTEILSYKGDINKAYQIYEDRFTKGLDQMKMKIGSFAPNRCYRRNSADSISRRRRIDGLERSAFDVRYSA